MTDEQVAAVKACYDDHLLPLFTSANGQKCDKFLTKFVWGHEELKKACTSEKLKADCKKEAMGPELGMKTGMELKKEIEGDCTKFKEAFKKLEVSLLFSPCLLIVFTFFKGMHKSNTIIKDHANY